MDKVAAWAFLSTTEGTEGNTTITPAEKGQGGTAFFAAIFGVPQFLTMRSPIPFLGY